jgi:hypothetical protein
MSVTNYTTADDAANALVNSAVSRGLTPSTQLSAQQLPLSVLANILANEIGGQPLDTGAGAGAIGTGGFVTNGVVREGGLIKTTICVDLTGLSSSTTLLDIIGQGVSPAFIGRVTEAQNGVIIGGTMQCLEAPVGGVTDIDLYVAVEATGAFDTGIATLTETVVVESTAAWTLGRVLGTAPDAVVNRSYLYLVCGNSGTAAAYTAGRILITLYGRPT